MSTQPTIATVPAEVLDTISKALPIVQGIAEALLPGAGAIASTAVQIAQGVIAGIPEAEALWAQFQNGSVPTEAEMQAYAASENSAYQQLMSDIAAKLAAS
jgi:hypothetical protein